MSKRIIGYVISHSGKPSGPWEAQGPYGTSTTDKRQRETWGPDEREPLGQVLGLVREVQGDACRIFRLVRRSKVPTLPTLERAVVEAAILLVESNAAVAGGSGALTALQAAVAALRAKRGG